MDRDHLAASVVGILDGAKICCGAGTILTKEGLIATCVHVLHEAGAAPGASVGIRIFSLDGAVELGEADVLSQYWWDDCDLALIYVRGPFPKGAAVAALGASTWRGGLSIVAAGFPHGEPSMMWAGGTLLGRNGSGELQISSTEVTSGFSGGPIADESTGHVIGIVREVVEPDDIGRLRDTAFGIPSERIRRLHGTLELSANGGPLDNPRAHGGQMKEVWLRYFVKRVVVGVFAAPFQFEQHLAFFLQDSNTASKLTVQAREILLRGEALGPALQRPLQRIVDSIQGDSDALAQAIEEAAEAIDRLNDKREQQDLGMDQHAYREGEDRFRSLMWGVSRFLADVRRLAAPNWFLVAPAGRGKSTLVWEIGQQLRGREDLVCILTGPDLDGSSSPEQLILEALHVYPATPSNFSQVGDLLWSALRRPLFVLVDAVNESRHVIQHVANQVAKLCTLAVDRPWLRVLFTCRDLYWDLVFESALGGYLARAIVDRQGSVIPRLDANALTRYLNHYEIRGLGAEEFLVGEWQANPLLLRVFCETHSKRAYDGPRPVGVRGFRLLERYFVRKQEELRERTFGTLDLRRVLIDVARAMIDAKQDRQDAAGEWGAQLPEEKARVLLGHRSQSGELLYDALIDQDLIFQVDLDHEADRYVRFTFERMQDYYLARALIDGAQRDNVGIDDSFLETCRSQVPPSALGTAVALALEENRVTDVASVNKALAASLPSVLDLVEPSRLQALEPQLAAAASSGGSLAYLATYLTGQMRSHAAERQSFIESFGVGLFVNSVASFELRDRHRKFYADIDLIDAIADVVEAEVTHMRGWARRGFSSFPETVVGADQAHMRLVVALLGANSPHVRDLSHEWLYWYGHFRPLAVYELIQGHLTSPDLLVRERVIALIYALTACHPELATRERLLRIYQLVLDKKNQNHTDHYLITEFARSLLLSHRAVIGNSLGRRKWNQIERPRRKRLRGKRSQRPFFPAEPEWTFRGPIRGDQSRYTFGRQFSAFAVRDPDLAVRQALEELPHLGYDRTFYEDLDATLGRIRDNPRIWNSSERRYERFGKTYAYVASWIILGRWAETQPINAEVVDPYRPFALDRPEYDYFFGVEPERLPAERAPSTLDFPEDLSWSDWKAGDERGYVRQFAEQFHGEDIIWGIAERVKGGRKFTVLIKGVLIDPAMLGPLAWASERLWRLRENTLSWLPEERSEEFEFHALGSESYDPEPFREYQIVAAFSERTRTLNDRDKTVLTVSARIIRAGTLRQLPTVGEFASEGGGRVVREVVWGERYDSNWGEVVLMEQQALRTACGRIGAAYGWVIYTDLRPVRADGETPTVDGERAELWSFWAPDAPPVPGWLSEILDRWERKHGLIRASLDLLAKYLQEALANNGATLEAELDRLIDARELQRRPPKSTADEIPPEVIAKIEEYLAKRSSVPEGAPNSTSPRGRSAGKGSGSRKKSRK